MTEIVVISRLVPDLVEELEIAPSGKALDLAWLRRSSMNLTTMPLSKPSS